MYHLYPYIEWYIQFACSTPNVTRSPEDTVSEISDDNYPNIAHSFAITGVMIAAMLLFSPIMVLAEQIDQEALSLVYEVLAVGTPCLYAYAMRKRRTGRTSFNLSFENTRIIPLVVIAAPLLLFGIAGPLSEFVPMPDSVRDAFSMALGQTSIFTFAMMVIAAPILEEVLFRGLILDGLLRQYSPSTAILISSFLFAVAHLNPWQFVTGMVLGLFMGWVYYRSRSLLAVIIIHAAANLSAYCVRLLLEPDSMKQSIAENLGGALNYGVFIAGSTLVFVLCIYLLSREFVKQSAHG